jgi:hypothetical protein
MIQRRSLIAALLAWRARPVADASHEAFNPGVITWTRVPCAGGLIVVNVTGVRRIWADAKLVYEDPSA